MVLSEIIRFHPLSSHLAKSAFDNLRHTVTAKGGVRDQYYGLIVKDVFKPRDKQNDGELCWVIQWPQSDQENFRVDSAFRKEVQELDASRSPRSILFDFGEENAEELSKGLTSPVTQFAMISLNSDSAKESMSHSMHKTFTDCYFAPGFNGGYWAYSSSPGHGRLAYYILGWESIEHRDAYGKTPLFAEEIDKLEPYYAPGSGAWFAKFVKH